MPKMEQLVADNTVLYNKSEKNIVYMFAELIDNAKASYEDVLGKDLSSDFDIDVRFDEQKGLIFVEDYGTGFDIFKGVHKFGRDKAQIDQTNQYYQGLKNAMTWFGDYSIITSERIIDGKSRRFVNLYMPYSGTFESDLELKPTGKTGSRVTVFKNFAKAKEFWRELDFLNGEDLQAFPEDNKDRTRYTNVEKILDNIEKVYPFLTASLFQRYSSVVNKFPNLKINFSLFGKDGMSKLHGNNFNGYIEGNLPVYFEQISSNKFDELAAFSFDAFRENNSKFYDELNNNPEFKKTWSEFLIYVFSKDYKTYFSNLEKEHGTGVISRWPGNLKVIDEKEFIKQKGSEWLELDEMEDYPFAKYLGEAFINMFLNGEGSFDNFKFNLEKMTINNAHIVAANRSILTPESQIFNIGFSLNISSDEFYSKKFDDLYNKHKVNQLSGFKVIQNDRAIYHGPNFKGANFDGVKYPENILVKELVDPDNFVKFPNSWKSNSGTEPSRGGNTEKITNKIYGNIFLANDENFSAGTNKAQIDNISIFEDFFIKMLMDSGLAVISKWDKLLKNNFDSDEIFTSKFEKKVLAFSDPASTKKPKNPIDAYAQFLGKRVQDSNDQNGSAVAMKEKSLNYASDIEKNIVSADVQEMENMPVDDLANITKRIMLDLRIRKQDNLVARNFDSFNQEQYTVLINVKGRMFNEWNRQIRLTFVEDNRADVELSLDTKKPIEIQFPVSFKNTTPEELRVKLSGLIDELIAAVANVNGFDKVLVESNKKVDSAKTVRKYLSKVLKKLNNIISEDDLDEDL